MSFHDDSPGVMALADYLAPESVLLDPVARDKWSLVERMVEQLSSTGLLPADRLEEAKSAVVARERSVSTGMEQGIAVPHAALEGLERVIAGMVVMRNGMDFQSLDGEPTRIVVLLLVPKNEKVLHVRTLTEVARRLGDPDFRQRILSCRNGDEVVALWS